MNEIIQTLAKSLLNDGKVVAVLGWQRGNPWFKRAPIFAENATECDTLVFDGFCYHNLPKMIIRNRDIKGKIAVFVKGCDSRSLLTMIQDKQLIRENLYIIGLPCMGMNAEPQLQAREGVALEDASKCYFCTDPNPVIYDEIIGETLPPRIPRHDDLLEQVEAMTQDEKYNYWQGIFSNCIRCFGCRNICPVCSCKECCFDGDSLWLDKGEDVNDNSSYHLTRAMHMAGRCVGCGECERVCPQGLPVMLLNRKLKGEIAELFPDDAPAGTNHEGTGITKVYRLDDPEEFM